jgi:hypothetical protein
MVFRCRRGRHDEPFGGLVVYLAGDCLQAQSDIQKRDINFKDRFHSDYSKIIFENPDYMKIFSLVYFPEDFNKRHVDEKFRNLVSDLRVGNLKGEHVDYLKKLGGNITNLSVIKEAMLIVNGDVLNDKRNIFHANIADKSVVLSRQQQCSDAYNNIDKTKWLWPLENVQIIYSEKKQLQKYEWYYQNSLKKNESLNTFKATVRILAMKDEVLLRTIDVTGDNITKQQWFLEESCSLPNDEIVIVKGNTFSIVSNSHQGYRHEPVKVIEVDENKVT